MPVVAVVGSLNMDFVVSVEVMPAAGQTVLGQNFLMIPGGKGANQACACGRLGGSAVRTRMAGRVGYDVFGEQLKASLTGAGVDVMAVRGTRSHPTGVAHIWVDETGQNAIVVAAGANQAFTVADANELRGTFHGAAYALFQLETPLGTVAAAMRLAREEGALTMLDPAPAQALDGTMLGLVDILTPNETEACVLLGLTPGRVSLAEGPGMALRLRERMGVRTVVLKLGEQGCIWADGDGVVHGQAFAVAGVDTTAAGDTFNGGLAVALAEGKSVREALRFANAAGALSVTRRGAQASIPLRAEVETFLQTTG